MRWATLEAKTFSSVPAGALVNKFGARERETCPAPRSCVLGSKNPDQTILLGKDEPGGLDDAESAWLDIGPAEMIDELQAQYVPSSGDAVRMQNGKFKRW